MAWDWLPIYNDIQNPTANELWYYSIFISQPLIDIHLMILMPSNTISNVSPKHLTMKKYKLKCPKIRTNTYYYRFLMLKILWYFIITVFFRLRLGYNLFSNELYWISYNSLSLLCQNEIRDVLHVFFNCTSLCSLYKSTFFSVLRSRLLFLIQNHFINIVPYYHLYLDCIY